MSMTRAEQASLVVADLADEVRTVLAAAEDAERMLTGGRVEAAITRLEQAQAVCQFIDGKYGRALEACRTAAEP